MSDKPISPLRQRMIDGMRARRFSEDTQRDYVRNVRNFTAFLGQSPDAPAGRQALSGSDRRFVRGLRGLLGGAEGIQTDGHFGLTPSGRGIHQNLSGGRFAVRS
jgi:hypothetical protein